METQPVYEQQPPGEVQAYEPTHYPPPPPPPPPVSYQPIGHPLPVSIPYPTSAIKPIAMWPPPQPAFYNEHPYPPVAPYEYPQTYYERTPEYYPAALPRYPEFIHSIPKKMVTKMEYIHRLSFKYQCHPMHLEYVLGFHFHTQVMFEACLANDWPEMYRMIKEYGAYVNAQVNGELTVIWYAARDGYFEIVQNLLLFGADPNICERVHCRTTLDMAMQKRWNKCINLLKAYGAKSGKRYFNPEAKEFVVLAPETVREPLLPLEKK